MESTFTLLAASTGQAVAFYALSALAIAAALLMVVQKNPVGSVLWLVVSFVGLAGLFLVMQAYFLAVIQILVYAGAILVLFLFVIMLLDLRPEEVGEIGLPRVPVVGLAAAALFLVSMIAVLAAAKPFLGMSMSGLIAQTTQSTNSVRVVGLALFNNWVLPFEVTSLLLLAAIVGAVAITKKRL
jgi:NADH-quinone oxidoreductase subunit J